MSVAGTLPSHAQTSDSAANSYPSRPIRLLIPFAPGGTTDVFASKYAERMSREGVPMVPENKAGASGAIAAAEVARAELHGFLRHPGLYLFVPLILLQTLLNDYNVGAFDTKLFNTAGLLATAPAATAFCCPNACAGNCRSAPQQMHRKYTIFKEIQP